MSVDSDLPGLCDLTVATTQDVLLAVAWVASVKGDDEAAHSAEDEVHRAVLRSIADGTAESPREMARAAMRTRDLEFRRWFA